MAKHDAAIAARDKALTMVKAGSWEGVGDLRMMIYKTDTLAIVFRTPFQRLPTESEESKYMRASLGGKANLPYGLDVFAQGKKVLNVEWDTEGNTEVISYKRGAWEAELTPA